MFDTLLTLAVAYIHGLDKKNLQSSKRTNIDVFSKIQLCDCERAVGLAQIRERLLKSQDLSQLFLQNDVHVDSKSL